MWNEINKGTNKIRNKLVATKTQLMVARPGVREAGGVRGMGEQGKGLKSTNCQV